MGLNHERRDVYRGGVGEGRGVRDVPQIDTDSDSDPEGEETVPIKALQPTRTTMACGRREAARTPGSEAPTPGV